MTKISQSLRNPGILASIMAAVIAFGIDRGQKAFHIAAECYAVGQSVCVGVGYFFEPLSLTGWRGGEMITVTPFFDYVLVWNTGISYGLFDSLPVWALGIVMLVAIAALSVWWWRSREFLVRLGLALCLGGALSNALDRLIYGAVADFFHFHWGTWSFYIFNLADVAITLGVILLFVDLLGFSRKAPRKAA
ncbi:lipoprotein signal peptidase [Devosia lucknowensis]|uniref:Lipoprotein signal peptidase n=1 Tax=Devosia lucknowensis TaxID=1096929 RepID=A0A1Y6E9F5_9HYPH|nr:signal peptidase II [Devosia lucknowensis]SMQ59235.1 lipoprotein signal peptidase [Devosia lucknowensis]